MYVNNFIARSKSVTCNTANIDTDLPKLVMKEDNEKLIIPIQDAKIKDTIFKWTNTKNPALMVSNQHFQDY